MINNRKAHILPIGCVDMGTTLVLTDMLKIQYCQQIDASMSIVLLFIYRGGHRKPLVLLHKLQQEIDCRVYCAFLGCIEEIYITHFEVK